MYSGTSEAFEVAIAVCAGAATVLAVPFTRRLDAGRFAIVGRTVALTVYSALLVLTGWSLRPFLISHLPIAAIGAVFITTGWIAYAQGLLRLARLLPDEISQREVRFYSARWSLVRAFGVLLRRSPLRHLNPSVYSRRWRDDFSEVEPRLVAAEIVHSWSGSISAVTLLTLVNLGCAAAFAVGFVAWVLEDIYPIFHLRYTRCRMAKRIPRSAINFKPT